jgi:TolB-like protein/Tfp pilus assembly protein PilF
MSLPAAFGAFILGLLIVGFPIAVTVSWFFEFTPDGIKRTVPSGEVARFKPQTADFALAVALVLVLAAVVVQMVMPRADAPGVAPSQTAAANTGAKVEPATQTAPVKAPDNAIAVLPFSNLTGKADDIAFAAGLHDDLLTRLAKIGALQVIARTSVLGYANTTKKISEIAKELGVAAVLEGSVQRAGPRVRITVQLIDPATDAQRWGETYDRTLTADNLFDMQREIAEAIGKALNTVLTARELTAAFKGGTRNLQAYEHFAAGRLKLRSAEFSRTDPFNEAIAAFDQAIALDPNFAAAHALKAYALGHLFFIGQRLDTKLRDEARAALDRAEALAPDATDTQFALAEYFYHGFLDYRQAMIHAERALKSSPNSADAWYIKAIIARRDGRFAVSNEAFVRTFALDPQNLQRIFDHAELLLTTGEFARVEMLIARAHAIDPTSPFLRMLEAWLAFLQGDAAGAWVKFKDVRSFAPAIRLRLATATRDAANIEFALEDWPEANRIPASAPELYEISRARALLALGKKEEARQILLAIKARVEASPNPYPAAWRSGVRVTPADVPGMLGDLAGVKAAEHDFLTNAPRDAFAKWDNFAALAVAFLRAGNPDRAMHYLEETEKLFGPAFYGGISIDPAFDALRDHPKYKALKTRYEAWAIDKAKGGAK